MREDIKLFLPLVLIIILMMGTLFLLQLSIEFNKSPYNVTVNDKYYLRDLFINGYYIEDLNIPLTHSRRISDYDEWNKMEIGKIYSCKNTPTDIFDMNPHHKSIYCEEV